MRHTDPEAIETTVGETVEVELTAHGVGGYEWHLEDAGALMMRETGVREVGNPTPGAGGVATFSLAAERAGRTELVFSLRRRWEAEPLRTRRVVVDIRA